MKREELCAKYGIVYVRSYIRTRRYNRRYLVWVVVRHHFRAAPGSASL